MKISFLVRTSIIIFIVLTICTFASLFAYISYNNKSIVTIQNQAIYKQLGLDLMGASDFLTDQAKNYVQYGEKVYYDDYMDEVENKKTRENVVARLKELGAPQSELDLIQKAANLSNTLAELETEAFEAVDKKDWDLARSLMFGESYNKGKAPIVTTMNEFQNTMNQRAERESNISIEVAKKMLIIAIIAICTTVIFGITSFTLISNKIKPINKLVNASTDIAEGNLKINLNIESNDEIGMIIKSFKKVADCFDMVVNDINKMSEEHKSGDFEYMMDEEKYSGIYKEVIREVNSMVSDYIGNFIDIMVLLQDVGNGDFDAPIKQYPGKQAVYNEIIEAFRSNLIHINKEITDLGQAAFKGNLSVRVEESRFKGDWAKMIVGLNNMLNAISDPIAESSAVLTEMSKGNFSAKMDGDYKGDFALIKNSMNDMTNEISSYITEINYVLNEIANSNNLSVDIKRNYIGDFISIKDSINSIISKLSGFIGEINNASDQVADGSRLISESAIGLAQGSAEQTNSIDELTKAVFTIDEETHKNADSAKMAKVLSTKSMDNASKGNDEMKKMLNSMDGIKEASNNISKIIKVIDDIAFQTNLLALNAAVEAARAGDKGKGFAVVAEEVRSLANRSQNAAKETGQMIEDTINKVDEGTFIAESTAKSLETIVLNVTEVSKIIEEISNSSVEQSSAVSQIVTGIKQISQIAKDNSATSEESASAAQELSSQAEMLKNMVNIFNLE